jgi:hypothetical protein
MSRRDIVVAYVIVAAVLLVAESALRSSYAMESLAVQRISEMSSIIGPLVVSWRLAARMQRDLSDAELLGAAFWCLVAQLTMDIAGIGVALMAGVLDESDTSSLRTELAPPILFAVFLRYVLLYLIIWVGFRFPGRWFARWTLRSPNVIA